MHGLDEIKRFNENPTAYIFAQEPQHGFTTRAEIAQGDLDAFANSDRRSSYAALKREGAFRNPRRLSDDLAEIGSRVARGALDDDAAFKADFRRQMPDYPQYVKDLAGDPSSPFFGRALSYAEWNAARKERSALAIDNTIFGLLLLDILTSAPVAPVAEPEPEQDDDDGEQDDGEQDDGEQDDDDDDEQDDEQEQSAAAGPVPVTANEPPFMRFWRKLNAHLTAAGEPEAGFKAAREAFDGGPTPIGSLTFIGKQWDGLRAVPSKPVKYLGGERPVYHGEYRVVTDAGTFWHKVTHGGEPAVYSIPEAAITAAEIAKKEYQ